MISIVSFGYGNLFFPKKRLAKIEKAGGKVFGGDK